MSNYKVTEKDLIGSIKGFPIEVVQKMLDRQKEQKGCINISDFQKNSSSGFGWVFSPEGHDFWQKVILNKDFDLFFKKYPKKLKYVYIYQDGTKNGKDVISTLVEYGGIDSLRLNGQSKGSIYYIRPDDRIIAAINPCEQTGILVKTFYTEIQPESSVKEYTLQEIADKLGIKVDELRIKK